MGAIVGAAVALEWDDAQIGERLRHAFVESNPMNDYTLPFVALVKGRKVSRRLEEHFGGVRIEDLWRPFFCVSTNLSAAKLTVHRDGPHMGPCDGKPTRCSECRICQFAAAKADARHVGYASGQLSRRCHLRRRRSSGS